MSVLRLDKNLPVVLVDTSYYIFYRYYSSLKWYSFRNKEIDHSRIDEDEEFMKGFFHHIDAELEKVCKKWKTKRSQIIFCCDCSRDNIWRHEHTGAYKQTRVASSTFNGNIFFRFYQHIESHQEEWGIHKVLVEHLEADDVAYLTRKALLEAGWDKEIYILTNDNDYLQLLDGGQTRIYNLSGTWNDISKRSCGNPTLDLRIKLIMGDKSDNIPAIHSGIGPKTAMKLAMMEEKEFDTYLLEKGCQEVFLRNQKIVDFQQIPQEYRDEYDRLYRVELV